MSPVKPIKRNRSNVSRTQAQSGSRLRVESVAGNPEFQFGQRVLLISKTELKVDQAAVERNGLVSQEQSMLHQAWSDGSFFPITNRSAVELVPEGATLMWSVEASSWVEAMTLYHKWRGWEPYHPLDDDPIKYTPEEEEEGRRLAAQAVRSPL